MIKFREFLKLREAGEPMSNRFYYGSVPGRKDRLADLERSANREDDDLGHESEDEGYDDVENARRFFGFHTGEQIDPTTLRSRKIRKEKEAQSPQDKEKVERYFQALKSFLGF